MAKPNMSYVDKLTWERLQEELKEADEATIKRMIDYEVKHRKRLQFLLRMHGRYNKLRTTRERNELMSSAAA